MPKIENFGARANQMMKTEKPAAADGRTGGGGGGGIDFIYSYL